MDIDVLNDFKQKYPEFKDKDENEISYAVATAITNRDADVIADFKNRWPELRNKTDEEIYRGFSLAILGGLPSPEEQTKASTKTPKAPPAQKPTVSGFVGAKVGTIPPPSEPSKSTFGELLSYMNTKMELGQYELLPDFMKNEESDFVFQGKGTAKQARERLKQLEKKDPDIAKKEELLELAIFAPLIVDAAISLAPVAARIPGAIARSPIGRRLFLRLAGKHPIQSGRTVRAMEDIPSMTGDEIFNFWKTADIKSAREMLKNPRTSEVLRNKMAQYTEEEVYQFYKSLETGELKSLALKHPKVRSAVLREEIRLSGGKPPPLQTGLIEGPKPAQAQRAAVKPTAPQKPATVQQAEKAGYEVLGIDAETKLPIVREKVSTQKLTGLPQVKPTEELVPTKVEGVKYGLPETSKEIQAEKPPTEVGAFIKPEVKQYETAASRIVDDIENVMSNYETASQETLPSKTPIIDYVLSQGGVKVSKDWLGETELWKRGDSRLGLVNQKSGVDIGRMAYDVNDEFRLVPEGETPDVPQLIEAINNEMPLYKPKSQRTAKGFSKIKNIFDKKPADFFRILRDSIAEPPAGLDIYKLHKRVLEEAIKRGFVPRQKIMREYGLKLPDATVKKDIPITKLEAEAYEAVEMLGSGPQTPQIPMPSADKLKGALDYAKTIFGDRAERFEALFGKEQGGEVFSQLRELESGLSELNNKIFRRNKKVFRYTSEPEKKQMFRVLKGIKELDAKGEPVFGALQPAGISNKVLPPGTVLPDGRIAGETIIERREIFQGTKQGKVQKVVVDDEKTQLFRKFDTRKEYAELVKKNPNTEKIFKKYLANEETILDTRMGLQIPAFSRNVMKTQYDIFTKKGPEFSYVPSYPKTVRPLTRLRNAIKSYTSPSRKFKTGELAEAGAEEENLQKVLTQYQTGIALESVYNKALANILSSTVVRMAGKSPDAGYQLINMNNPNIKKVTEQYKELFLANGINTDKITNYQIPTELVKHFKLDENKQFIDPNMQQAHDFIQQAIKEVVSTINAGLLLRPSTAVRNFNSGMLQFSHQPLTHMWMGLFEGDFNPLMNDLRAISRSLTPKVIEELPAEVLGQTFTQSFIERLGTKIYKYPLYPFQAIEVYIKRIVADASLNIAADKAFDLKWAKGEIQTILRENGVNEPILKKSKYREQFRKDYREKEFLNLFRFFRENIDLVAYDYKNLPKGIEKMPYLVKGGLPFTPYPYKRGREYEKTTNPLRLKAGYGFNERRWIAQDVKGDTRTAVLHFSPANAKYRYANFMAGLTEAALYFTAAGWASLKTKKFMEELGYEKLPWLVDTTGRIKIFSNDKIDAFVRAYDMYGIGDALLMLEMTSGEADFSDFMSSYIGIGPLGKLPLYSLGFRDKYSTSKPLTAAIGKEMTGMVPFGAWINYARILYDPIKRQTFSKDFNAFQNFVNPLVNISPATSEGLPPSTTRSGEIRKYDMKAEHLKFWFLNVKTIEKEDLLEFEEEAKRTYYKRQRRREARKRKGIQEKPEYFKGPKKILKKVLPG